MSKMKSVKSIISKIFGGIFIFLGCIFACTSLTSIINMILGVSKSVGDSQDYGGLGFAFVLTGSIAFFLIRFGYRRIKRSNDVLDQIKAEKAEKLAKEAEIKKQEYELEQLELKTRLAEQERLLAIEREAERQRAIEAEKKKENEFIFLTDEQIDKLEQQIELPNLDDCELILQRGEIAIYGSHATWITSKGVETFFGHVFFTNQRIGFVSEEKGFILYHSDIIAVGTKSQGLIFQAKQGTYSIEVPRSDLANIALKGLRTGLPIAGMYENGTDRESASNDCIDDVSKVDGMEGHTFEHFCAELLEKNGFCNVEVTKGSGDQGVDILASKGRIKYAIQCKNYASRLGNTPIQEVNAGRIYYNCHVAVVMTNSTFTPAAEELANSTNVLLWDRDVLDEFIKEANKVTV